MQSIAIPIVQDAVNQDPEPFILAQPQTTAAMYMMCEAIVPFDTCLCNISYFATGQGKMKAVTVGGRQRRCAKSEIL